MKIPIYQQEKTDGLTELIQASYSFSYLSPLSISEPIKLPENLLSLVYKEGFNWAKANENNIIDLFYIKSILASSVWNKNDDYLEKKQIWLARKTPVNKQLNVDHDDNQIIGHMIEAHIIDDKFNLVADDTPIDELPEKIHIVDASVIYKYWKDEKLQEKVTTLIKAIEEKKKFVSMEALFTDFAYAYINEETGEEGIIERTKATSFLTKYLRVYGGEGKYKKYKLARMPLNFVFSGKGIVDNPANPESIILGESINFITSSINVGYKNIELILSGENEMNELEKKLKDLEEKYSELEAKHNELNKSLDSKNVLVTELQASVEAYKTEACELAKKNKELEAEKALAGRLTKLVEFGYEKADAEKVAASLKALSDEDFNKYCETTFNLTKVKAEEKAKTEAATAALETAKVKTENPVNPSVSNEDKIKSAQAKLSNFLKNQIKG